MHRVPLSSSAYVNYFPPDKPRYLQWVITALSPAGMLAEQIIDYNGEITAKSHSILANNTSNVNVTFILKKYDVLPDGSEISCKSFDNNTFDVSAEDNIEVELPLLFAREKVGFIPLLEGQTEKDCILTLSVKEL